MPRKGSVSKRDVLPDPIYNSKLVTRLINKIMLDGKKGTAKTFYMELSTKLNQKQVNQQWMFLLLQSITSCQKSN